MSLPASLHSFHSPSPPHTREVHYIHFTCFCSARQPNPRPALWLRSVHSLRSFDTFHSVALHYTTLIRSTHFTHLRHRAQEKLIQSWKNSHAYRSAIRLMLGYARISDRHQLEQLHLSNIIFPFLPSLHLFLPGSTPLFSPYQIIMPAKIAALS